MISLMLVAVALALPTTPTWQALGGTAGGYMGLTLAVGDVDGDGDDELLVGSPNAGRVDIYAGSPTGPSVAPVTTVLGPVFDGFAEGLAIAGDVNGDGYDDVLTGAPYYGTSGQPEEGRVSLFL